MGWASAHIEALRQGRTVQFRPRGNSMAGKIESGQLVTVAPIALPDVAEGDIVLCRVRSNEYLHLVKTIKILPYHGRIFLIGNNRGKNNGWTRQVFGKCIRVET